MKLEKTDSMSSRTGRDLQRYNVQGCRQVVGCIPYRYRQTKQSSSIHGTIVDDLEFLLVSSQKSPRMMFPKGGWEQDESLEEAALRETFEEAGIYGQVGSCLGKWFFKSKSLGVLHEGFMLPLIVMEELDDWPEKDVRQRLWVSYSEAMEVCFHPWMKEALELLVSQLTLGEGDEDELTKSLWNEEPKIDFLSQSLLGKNNDLVEETRKNFLTQRMQRKEDEISMKEGPRKEEDRAYWIEILVSDEPLRNQETRTSCAIEFLRSDEARKGIRAHSMQRNEEQPRTRCSIEFLRIEEPRMGILAPTAEEEVDCCFLLSS